MGRNNQLMSRIPQSVYKDVTDNDIGDVVFQDPFQDEARKAKRNLVLSSFAALLITALDLHVNGFLGLQTTTGTALGASITKGLACVTVIYFLAGFSLSAFVDYSAWKFKRERHLIKPYLDLISILDSHTRVTGEQINNATICLENLSLEKEMQAEIELQKAIHESLDQLKQISTASKSLKEEIRPLLESWAATVKSSARLTWRLRARFISLWLLDICVPVVLAGFAIWKTYEGICVVIAKIAA